MEQGLKVLKKISLKSFIITITKKIIMLKILLSLGKKLKN